jgi:hypothetical protein
MAQTPTTLAVRDRYMAGNSIADLLEGVLAGLVKAGAATLDDDLVSNRD